MHDLIVAGVPLLAILAGILFNRSDMQNLRTELKPEIGGLRSEFRSDLRELRSEMIARFDRVNAELRYFYGVTGKLEGGVEALENVERLAAPLLPPDSSSPIQSRSSPLQTHSTV